MKLYFMKEDALAYFKGNIEYNLDYYAQPSNSWIFDKYPGNPLQECKFEVESLNMDMSEEKPENTDCRNVKIIYEALKDISNKQAADERFWAGLSHSVLWGYMQYRCKFIKEDFEPEYVLNNYFFNQGLAKSLVRNSISRLWWIGRLLYNSRAEDPYAALKYLEMGFIDKLRDLFSYTFCRNASISRALMTALAKIEDEEQEKISRDQYREILQYMNMLGGIVMLDYLTEEELEDKIVGHYYKVTKFLH